MSDKVVEFVADLMSRGKPKIKVTNGKPDVRETAVQVAELVVDGVLYAAPLIVGGTLIASCGVWGGVLGYQFTRDFLKKDITAIIPQAKESIAKQKTTDKISTQNEILKIAKELQKDGSK